MLDLEKVRRWRRRIPWNNAQIEIALRDEAAEQPNDFMRDRYLRKADHLARTGRFTAHTLSTVLGRLIKICAICGTPALYRIGYQGRCRLHQLVGLAAAHAGYQARNNAQAFHQDQVDREQQYAEKCQLRSRQGKGTRSGVERSR